MLGLKRDPGATRPSKHAIALLALTTLVGIFASFAILSRMADQRNQQETRAERSRVIRAAGELHARIGRDVAALARLPRFDAAPLDIGQLDQVLLINSGNADPIAVLAGQSSNSSTLDRSILDFTRSITLGSAKAAEGMIAAGDLFDVVATGLPSADTSSAAAIRPARVIIGLRQIDRQYLIDLARAAGVSGVELIQRTSEDPSEHGTWSSTNWRGFGLIWAQARPGNRLMIEGTIVIMTITAILAVVIILRARREAGRLHASETRAIEASRNDWLSGLPNRAFFNHVLERDLKTLRHGSGKMALLHLDIDRFKDINDTYGLEAGDLMIQAVTRRIESVLQKGQSLARFEGDTFSVLLPDIQDMTACERICQTFRAAMTAPFEIDRAAIILTLSIGIAVAPDDASERAELTRLANLALHRAKREGRDRLAFYKPDFHHEWRRRSSIELALRKAIASGGLVMRYQPIIDGKTGETVCAEALVRWNHPSEGLIAPSLFIGLAEDRGLIVPIGEWILREACQAAKQWPNIKIAVNVSPIQIRQKDFCETVFRVVEESGIDPSRLELELTEGVLLDHEAEVLAAMASLRSRGIRLAIDDFGTGYSSLIYLRRFAIDKIKIDRAFIDAVEPDTEAAILVTSVVQLGRALGLTVTAEGIETEQQRDFLSRLGCHQLQGYLIAQPLSEADFTDFLRRGDATHRSLSERAVA